VANTNLAPKMMVGVIMKRTLVVLALAAAGLTGCRRANAQVPGEVVVGDDQDCSLGYTVDFGLASIVPDLAAQSDLNEAARWVGAEPGRYLRILRDPGYTREQARVANVRASAVVQFISQAGINPNVLAVGDVDELQPNQVQASISGSTIAILTCFGLPPRGP
jgi:hypothetical protein